MASRDVPGQLSKSIQWPDPFWHGCVNKEHREGSRRNILGRPSKRFLGNSESRLSISAAVLRSDAACQPQKRFGSVKRLVFDNGWAVEAKAKKRLVEAFQPPARGSSTPPCKKVRLAKAVVINDNIKTATTQVGHKPHDAGGGPPRWSVAHCKSIHRDDFVDSRAQPRK